MALENDSQLLDGAEEIRDETGSEQNTAVRVGSWMVDMVDSKTHIDLVEGIKYLTANATLERYDFYISCQGACSFLQLPAGIEGKYYFINNLRASGTVLVVAATGEDINSSGNSSYTLANGNAMMLKYNDTTSIWETVVFTSQANQSISNVLTNGDEVNDTQSVVFGDWELRRTGTTFELYNNVEDDVQIRFDAFKDVTEGTHAFVGKELARTDGAQGSSSAAVTLNDTTSFYLGLPSAPQTVTIPAFWPGKQITLINGDDNETVTLTSATTHTFGPDATSTYVLQPGDWVIISRIGNNWTTLKKSGSSELNYTVVAANYTVLSEDRYLYIRNDALTLTIPTSLEAQTFDIINPEGYTVNFQTEATQKFDISNATTWTTNNNHFRIVKDSDDPGFWNYIPITDWTQNEITTSGGSETISFKYERSAKLILEGSVSTLNLTDLSEGHFTLLVQQDATGGRLLFGIQRNGVGADVVWIEGSEQGVNSGADAYTIYKFYDDGSKLIARKIANYLESGDNVSELTNDAGYLNFGFSDATLVMTGNTSTLTSTQRLVFVNTTSGVTINLPVSPNGRRIKIFNPNGSRIRLATDTTDSTPFSNGDDQVRTTYTQIDVIRQSGTWYMVEGGKDYLSSANFNTGSYTYIPSIAGSLEFTVDESGTFTFSDLYLDTEHQGLFVVKFVMDSTGGYTVTFSGFEWMSGVAPTVGNSANEETIVFFYCDGSQLYGWAPGQFDGPIQDTQIATSIENITSNTNVASIHARRSHNVDASSAAITFTVNDASNTGFEIGDSAEFWAEDLTNDIDFAVAGSQSIISVDSNLKIGNQGGAVILQKRAANTWALIGDLKA